MEHKINFLQNNICEGFSPQFAGRGVAALLQLRAGNQGERMCRDPEAAKCGWRRLSSSLCSSPEHLGTGLVPAACGDQPQPSLLLLLVPVPWFRFAELLHVTEVPLK